MPSHSNSSSSSSPSDDDKNPSPHPNPNPNPNPHSIDQSLDAIENQLAAISMVQPDSLLEPEPESESESGVNHEIREELVNGSLMEIEELPAKSAMVEEEVEEGEEEKEEKLKPSSSRVWTNVSEMEEGEVPSSPSSSGYAGGRGSSATSGVEEEDGNDDEIVQVRNNGDFDGVADSQAPWTPGKRHGDEVSLRKIFEFLAYICYM